MHKERHTCTASEPWDKEKHGPRAIHPDADLIAERDFGGGEYCEHYECPHCKHRFYVELPQ